MTDSDDCPCLPSAESGTCPHGDRVLWAEFDQTPATPEPTPGADPFALLAACGDHILDLLIARHALAVAVQKIGNTMNRYVTTGLVNDAWRNQWHPAEGQHRPRWIAPYIKGPEGAPMLTQPKVYVWSRT